MSGPDIVIRVEGVDPTNPRHRMMLSETVQAYRERFGIDDEAVARELAPYLVPVIMRTLAYTVAEIAAVALLALMLAMGFV